MRAELITDLADAAAIEDDWRRLATLRGNAFLTPDWYSAWLADPSGDHEPRIVVARRDDGEVAGVLPLALYPSNRPRALRFGGSEFGDNFGIASSREDEGAVAEAAAAALGSELGSALLVLHWIDRDGDWPERLAAAAPRRIAVIEQNSAEMPRVAVAGKDWEGYLADRSRKFRQRVARGLEKTLDSEGITHSVRETADPAALDKDLATLFRLHDLRHEESGSSISEPRVREFLTGFSRAALERGWLRLRILELDGQPAAAFLAWRIGSRYALYQSGFDPGFSEQSAGMVLLNDTIRSAVGEHVDEIDLLLGGEAFKWRFAPEPGPVRTMVLVGASRPARLLVSAEAAARRHKDFFTDHPRLERMVRPLARLLPGGRSS